MIALHGKQIDLPQFLRPCGCGRGSLVWDGRFAWRCDYRENATKRCGVGFTLNAFFDDPDLDLHLSLGTDLRRLRMTHFALSLVARGLLSLTWLTAREARTRMIRLRDLEEENTEFIELQGMMRRVQERGA